MKRFQTELRRELASQVSPEDLDQVGSPRDHLLWIALPQANVSGGLGEDEQVSLEKV